MLRAINKIITLKNIKSNNYFISFGDNGYKKLNEIIVKNNYSKIFIITDTNSNELCSNYFLQQIATELIIEIIEFENGETHKNIDTCVEIWSAINDLGGDRKSLIINLGGGVVTDLGGFVASTYKRGIDFINVPTTLLGMVDASIGGKNGVDLGHLKNQIGTINNPKQVLIDSTYLSTLSQAELRSGYAEMLKHGLIFDETHWTKLLHYKSLTFADFDKLIYDSIKIKNSIVKQDPTENGIRKALNFGHTLGHAIESYFLENEHKVAVLHGEAVAAGIILESFLSLKAKLISNDVYLNIKTVIHSIFEKIEFDAIDIQRIIDLLIYDKKNEYGKVQFVLLKNIGEIVIEQFVDNEHIIAAFADYKN